MLLCVLFEWLVDQCCSAGKISGHTLGHSVLNIVENVGGLGMPQWDPGAKPGRGSRRRTVAVELRGRGPKTRGPLWQIIAQDPQTHIRGPQT